MDFSPHLFMKAIDPPKAAADIFSLSQEQV